jgi:hypothetical protein
MLPNTAQRGRQNKGMVLLLLLLLLLLPLLLLHENSCLKLQVNTPGSRTS